MKHLLVKKKRAADADKENKARDLSGKISRMIAENRRRWGGGGGVNGARGTKHWWRQVGNITLRKQKSLPCLDKRFLAGLNNFFGDLCTDDHYGETAPLVIDCETHPPPRLREHDVLLALSGSRKLPRGQMEFHTGCGRITVQL